MDELGGSNAVLAFVVQPARENEAAVALIDAVSDRTWSRGDVLSGVRAAGATLAARSVQPEQRILICCADTPAFLHWFWGAMWIGAVPVPVSTMLKSDDYRFLLEDSRAVGLVYSPEFTEVAGEAPEDHRFLRWSVNDTDTGDLSREGDCPDVYPATDDDVAFWLYTSGTTGFPKAAIHRHIDLGFCTEQYARGVLDMGPDDIVYSVAKLFFAYGLGNAGYFPGPTGARAVLNPGRPVLTRLPTTSEPISPRCSSGFRRSMRPCWQQMCRRMPLRLYD